MTKRTTSGISRAVVSTLVLALAGSGVAHAQSSPVPNMWDGSWHYALTPYGWLPGISATMRYQLPGGGVADTKTNNNVFDYLSGALMLEFEARKDDWGVYTDLDWVKFSGEKGRFRSIGGDRIGGDTTLDTRWGLKAGMFNLAALYSIDHGNWGYADVIFGARYLWVKGNLSWDFTATGNGGRLDIADNGKLHNQMHITDAIVGLKGAWTPFEDSHFFFPYYVDVGAGGSDITWQLRVGAAYGFDWGNIALLYRDVQYDASGNDKLIKRLELSGPAISVTWNF